MDDPDFAADIVRTVFGRFLTTPPTNIHVRRLGSGTWTNGQGSWVMLIEGVAELHAQGGVFTAYAMEWKPDADGDGTTLTPVLMDQPTDNLKTAITLVMGAYVGVRICDSVYDEIDSRKPD